MKYWIKSNRWYLAGTGFVGASVFCFIRYGVDMEQQFQRKLRDTWAEASDVTVKAAETPKAE